MICSKLPGLLSCRSCTLADHTYSDNQIEIENKPLNLVTSNPHHAHIFCASESPRLQLSRGAFKFKAFEDR